ncbi:MAG: hypothetical protein CML47_10610 [Rhodobacteraceae bacterium]|nr:MAG: hypothetical protein CML47_10610 [Paracoccaceae bacterium]|tara:strand:- start:11306 stop:11947 length:642 start_codon:yes stop_codon:yes gene_type:complete
MANSRITFNIYNSRINIYNGINDIGAEGVDEENLNDSDESEESVSARVNEESPTINDQDTPDLNTIDLASLLNLGISNLGNNTTFSAALGTPIRTNNQNDSSGANLNNIQDMVGGIIQSVLNIPAASLQVEVVEAQAPQRHTSVQSLHSGTILSIINDEHVQDENNPCTICHSPFQSADIIRTINNCSHFFHANCIEQWFQSHNNCPVCRGTL